MKIFNQHQISLPQTDSSGFAVEVVEDNVIVDDRGQPRTMTCGTEKSKHRAKNHRTAGTQLMRMVNKGMQSRRSVLFCYPICRSDVIFGKLRIYLKNAIVFVNMTYVVHVTYIFCLFFPLLCLCRCTTV